MQAWLDVTAGVAGDMVMGALVDAGAELDGVQAAVRAVAGDGIRLRREEVARAGLVATKIHVDIVATGSGPQALDDLRARVDAAALAAATKALALETLDRLSRAYSAGHDIPSAQVTLQEVAALDVLTDVVGDCEALRLLGVDTVTASSLAVGSGRIRTTHGDLAVPAPAVAALVRGWPVANPDGSAPAESPTAGGATPDRPHPLRHEAGRYVPLAGVSGDDGVITEEPAQVVGGVGLGELATPTGVALLRSFAEAHQPRPPMPVTRTGVGAGGRDVPGRPNVVRVLLG